MRVLITGAEGQLGKELCSMFRQEGYTVFPLNKKELNITDVSHINGVLDQLNPGVIINAAAFTKVDLCETEIDKALAINALGPYYLAKEAKKRKMKLLHISTDYVFSGESVLPYKETDTMQPINMYGKSKQLGEELACAINSDITIVRTSWLYGHSSSNFVHTMKRLAETRDEIHVVHDQQGCPTYTKDLGVAIKKLLAAPPGIYHVSNSGSCTWFEFAAEIMKLLNKPTKVIPISSEEYKMAAKRPKNSVLCHEKMNQLGIHVRHWQEGLREYIREEWGTKG
ncbi:dTDP-4-dehydrorhamnose reductase [Priestia taiwanensis]|uniref:dTDP-4-dehydrorhamnose reductase n=1 Tax=Priestia taiwanensis TaxID=1347902 RepID=A0A917ASJ1_9BACI|nr:dTDP-4-dehydrorhamnose reductase [Priestia taiwanensis]MBM7364152.1 dTDP-4-dehydrorhamnose reductase [Priestia taiwanensis]GGE72041.1 spore coat polysaccharide biosynthesis protein SpsK [Priestia taiwanensis]